MVTDNSRNWRFRYELAEYVSFIISIVTQFNVNCVNHVSCLYARKLNDLKLPVCLTKLSTLSPSRQLILIIELYSHYDVYDYLRQIALTLCSDKVSEVRWISYKLVSAQCCILGPFCW